MIMWFQMGIRTLSTPMVSFYWCISLLGGHCILITHYSFLFIVSVKHITINPLMIFFPEYDETLIHSIDLEQNKIHGQDVFDCSCQLHYYFHGKKSHYMEIRLANWLSLLRDSVTIMSAYSRTQLIFQLILSSQIHRSTYWPTSVGCKTSFVWMLVNTSITF